LSLIRQHLRHADTHAAFIRERLPRGNVGMMIEFGDNDLVARLKLTTERTREMKRERRHVCAERDLVRGGVEEVCESLSRCVNQRIGFRARRIRPMRVGVMAVEIIRDGFDHGARNLCAARPVEVGDGVTVV
jgi:hypothetical protein